LEKARAKLVEEQNRQTALEVRKAELEIERHDRRIPGMPPVPLTDSGTEKRRGVDAVADSLPTAALVGIARSLWS
jgi:hypothetical protein